MKQREGGWEREREGFYLLQSNKIYFFFVFNCINKTDDI